MGTSELLWNGLAAILTLAIFSFLYRDNPFYKFAERLVAGVSAGYWTMLLYHTSFTDKVIVPIFQQNEWWYIIPSILGLMMWTRFSRKWSWLSRISLAFYIGISAGVALPISMYASIYKQLEASMVPIAFDMAGINSVLVTIGLICSLAYFFFSKEHSGLFGKVSRVGIYTLMIGFGAGFGLTVMGRISLFIDRVLFLKDYILALFGA
ncbi:MAG: hypothetical protein CO189_11940 [candidate division Zixibacteria bacterium CG_4_9_14_3_um_filter_46_8]|nr:MAG: hypothetical protein CO189_11940 [candidate division Zixibacteria bacterium CG_4_9_14_3_um_filter_46_8]